MSHGALHLEEIFSHEWVIGLDLWVQRNSQKIYFFFAEVFLCSCFLFQLQPNMFWKATFWSLETLGNGDRSCSGKVGRTLSSFFHGLLFENSKIFYFCQFPHFTAASTRNSTLILPEHSQWPSEVFSGAGGYSGKEEVVKICSVSFALLHFHQIENYLVLFWRSDSSLCESLCLSAFKTF